jgi:hypothetical protein
MDRVTSFPLPTNLVESIAEDDSPERKEWLGRLPEIVGDLAERWSLDVGDLAYDVLQHMTNCRDRLLADPRALARRMAGLAGLDVERVQLWLFARVVQESMNMPWLRQVVPRLAPR